MKQKIRWGIGICLFLILSANLSAYGGGGIFQGMLSDPAFMPDWVNSDFFVSARYGGGFGYGVTHSGQRIGGFGTFVRSDSEDIVYEGGFGGIISGQQFRFGIVTLSLNLWLGLGGVRTNIPDWTEYFAYFAEANFEIGIALLPWMQISAYAGMQSIGNLEPEKLFVEEFQYCPVLGFRMSWGGF